ncbi:MAG: hypothetical protein WC029_04640 [Sulfuricella sp.]
MMNKFVCLNLLKFLLLIGATSVANAALVESYPAASLRAKYVSLGEQLRLNQFKRPLVLGSAETQDSLKGDIYAIVDYPFEAVSAGLNNPEHWCDVMILHINTKYCHAVAGPSGTILVINVGKKTPEELADAARVEFNYSVATATPEYFAIMLNAKDGPLGTSDFHITLEAMALKNTKTFLHLTYSYSMNFPGRLAMKTYLGTVGRSKIGFTVTGKRADGKPAYIGGVRGLMERNTMRYYLAIDSFLGAARAAPAVQLEKRLQSWFTASERYSRQLHEMDRSAYLEMKHAEYLRQQTMY